MNLSFWMGAVLVFSVLEGLTVSLTSVWFALGALAALIATALGANPIVQFWLFLSVSVASLLGTRPVVRCFLQRKAIPTNADRVLGCQASVTEETDMEHGSVYVDGKTWSARSEDGSTIPVGTLVDILRIEGVKLIVKEIKKELVE